MTACDSSRRQPRATQRTVLLERFNGIRGTAWIIAARRWKQRRQCHLIPAYHQYEEGTHRGYMPDPSAEKWAATDMISSRSDANSAEYDSRRARIAMSVDGRSLSFGNSSIRTSSRSRRFRRFRSTAECRWRGTTTPIRECARGEARARTSRCTVRIRFPSRMTFCRSRPRVSRLRRGNPKP
jgi:hypothetical protein